MIDLNKAEKIIGRYLRLFTPQELKGEDLAFIEKRLDIVLPEDFVLISKYFSGDSPSPRMSLFSFDPQNNDWNIVSQTLEFRETVRMPRNYLVLKNEGPSFIAMLTKGNHSDPTPVYWIGLSDVYNLAEGNPLEDNPTIFPSFTDFFEYLVTEAEKEAAEEKT